VGTELRKIHLVRHAESLWNSERRVQGQCLEVPLSSTGRAQARLLGGPLRKLGLSAVYSSDAERALETTRLALGAEYPIEILPELREMALGEWEGRLVSEIRAAEPDKIETWYRKPSAVRIEGGENLHSFRTRVISVMDRLIEASGTSDIAIVTHGGVICGYLTVLLDMDIDNLWSFSLPNASITTVVLDFRPRLRTFGDTAHLDERAIGLDGMPAPL
jgi:broad specificity phosphatase PhoE